MAQLIFENSRLWVYKYYLFIKYYHLTNAYFRFKLIWSFCFAVIHLKHKLQEHAIRFMLSTFNCVVKCDLVLNETGD